MGIFEIIGAIADAIAETETRKPTPVEVVQPDVVIVRQTQAAHPSACAAIKAIAASAMNSPYDSDRETAAYDIRKVVIAADFAEDVSTAAVEELVKIGEHCHYSSSKELVLRQIKRISRHER
jgi:hypothetical protein